MAVLKVAYMKHLFGHGFFGVDGYIILAVWLGVPQQVQGLIYEKPLSKSLDIVEQEQKSFYFLAQGDF